MLGVQILDATSFADQALQTCIDQQLIQRNKLTLETIAKYADLEPAAVRVSGGRGEPPARRTSTRSCW
jgi:hypothetical protein